MSHITPDSATTTARIEHRWAVRRYRRAVRGDNVLCYRHIRSINDEATEVAVAYVWGWQEIGRWAVTSWKAGDRHTYHASFATPFKAMDHARQRVGLPLPVREDRHAA